MTEPIWIDQHLALALHDKMLARFGGAAGVRDEALLASALSRPQQQYHYAQNPDIFDLGMAYAAGIVRNHPFVDGNKRTGFITAILFLELNGARFTASEEAAARAVIELASGSMDEVGFAAFLSDNSQYQASEG